MTNTLSKEPAVPNEAIAVVENLPVPDRGFMAIIEKAAALETVDVDKLERMMAMQLQWEDRQARKMFDEARARVSAKLAHIKVVKNRAVAYDVEKGNKAAGQREAFKYAALEDIDRLTRPILDEEKIVVSYDTEPCAIPGWHTIVCWLSCAGHREPYRIPMPLDTSGGKGNNQAMGSTQSYGMKRAYCGALNIITIGQDDEGMGGTIDAAQAEHIHKLITESKTDMPRFLAKICHGVASVEDIAFKDYRAAVSALNEKIAKMPKGKENANPAQS